MDSRLNQLFSRKRRKYTGFVALLAATFFWGITFPVVKEAIESIPEFLFLAIRFLAAAALLLPVCFIRTGGARDRRYTVGHGAIGIGIGLLLTVAFALQTFGLRTISPSHSGFITGTNVIFVAIFVVVFFNTNLTLRIILALLLSLAGLALISPPTDPIDIGTLLTLGCALFFALHLIAIDRLAGGKNSVVLATVQFFTAGGVCLILSLWTGERWDGAWTPALLGAFAVVIFGATLFAFWAQMHFQPMITPIRAAFIFTMEPVFALLFSVLFYADRPAPLSYLGMAAILAAMIIAIRRE